MTDIQLEVGIQTKKARDSVLALVKSLNGVEEILKRINSKKLALDGLDKGLKKAEKASDSLAKKETKNSKSVEDIRLKAINNTIKSVQKATKLREREESRVAKLEATSARKVEDIRLAAINNQIKAVKKLKETQEKATKAAKKAADDADRRDLSKQAKERLKMHNKLQVAAKKEADLKEKAARDEINNRLKVHNTILKANKAELAAAESSARKELEARLKTHNKVMKAKLAESRLAARASGGAGVKTGATGAVGKHTTALNRNSKAAYRAASANKANNAILSDQAGFWRFAARGAALYFSSLATDRLLAVNLEMEALQQALIAIGGSQEAGAESMEFVSDTAKRLGLTLGSLGTGYKQLAAATKGTSLEGAIANDIFESVAEAATVMKLSVADTDGVMRALSQIMSKGKVSSEELRQQLGDRLKLLTLYIVICISKFA